MYYIKIENIDGEDNLVYYCRNCGNKDNDLAKQDENLCVSKINIQNNDDTYHNIINEYTKLDPTLPRTNIIKCPKCNDDANNNEDDANNNEDDDDNNDDDANNHKNSVIYIRYNDDNMKFIYLCEICDNVWKID